VGTVGTISRVFLGGTRHEVQPVGPVPPPGPPLCSDLSEPEPPRVGHFEFAMIANSTALLGSLLTIAARGGGTVGLTRLTLFA